MSGARAVAEPHKPTPEQRRRAVISAVVLAAMAAAIYATIIIQFSR